VPFYSPESHRFTPGRIVLAASHGSITAFTGRSITIPQIQPQRPIIPQHPPHLTEHLDHLGNVFFGRGLKAKLLVDTLGTAFTDSLHA